MERRSLLVAAASIAALAASSCAGRGASSAAAPGLARRSASRPASPPAQASAPLPHAVLATLDGRLAELGDLTRGRVALVSMWATWCESCWKEFDALNRLSLNAAARSDALVVGVAVGEQRATVDAFVRSHGLRYPQLVDEECRLVDALGQRDVPATLVLDRTGRIVYRGETLDRESLGAFRSTLDAPP